MLFRTEQTKESGRLLGHCEQQFGFSFMIVYYVAFVVSYFLTLGTIILT